jgi:hypothetical protein
LTQWRIKRSLRENDSSYKSHFLFINVNRVLAAPSEPGFEVSDFDAYGAPVSGCRLSCVGKEKLLI